MVDYIVPCFTFFLGAFIACWIFYKNKDYMFVFMKSVDHKLNKPKLDPSTLTNEGYKCSKCDTYYEFIGQDNKQIAESCCNAPITHYFRCLKCGGRWKTQQERDSCKHDSK